MSLRSWSRSRSVTARSSGAEYLDLKKDLVHKDEVDSSQAAEPSEHHPRGNGKWSRFWRKLRRSSNKIKNYTELTKREEDERASAGRPEYLSRSFSARFPDPSLLRRREFMDA